VAEMYLNPCISKFLPDYWRDIFSDFSYSRVSGLPQLGRTVQNIDERWCCTRGVVAKISQGIDRRVTNYNIFVGIVHNCDQVRNDISRIFTHLTDGISRGAPDYFILISQSTVQGRGCRMRGYANFFDGCRRPNSNNGPGLNISKREHKGMHRLNIIGLHETKRVCCITTNPDIRVAQCPYQQWYCDGSNIGKC